MRTRSGIRHLTRLAGILMLLVSLLACSSSYLSGTELTATAQLSPATSTSQPARSTPTTQVSAARATPTEPAVVIPTYTDQPENTSTPQPTVTTDPNATPKPPILYYTQAGDTLPSIARRFGVRVDQIQTSEVIPQSGLVNPKLLLLIPDVLTGVFDSTIILPDSEVVYSPSAADFDVGKYVLSQDGYLKTYSQPVGNQKYSGAEIVELVAMENSVNPYLLLTLLEYKSHWVTGQPLNLVETDYPMGYVKLEYKGLYKQLSWVVEQLAVGYYGWRAGTLSTLRFRGGEEVRLSPGLNAGSVAMQYLFAQWYDKYEWAGALYGEGNMPWQMKAMFGDFFERAKSVDPLYPADLAQPQLELPFLPGRVWSYTGGPHGAWAPTGALAAIDFAPPSVEGGCVDSPEWVSAMAPGVIVWSENGLVIEDLDSDGNQFTGWNIIYLHIATKDRVPVGTRLETGGKIGHPSCEGGSATGTHVHVARKFNGEWILADGPLPFELSGYTVHAGAAIYEGTLENGADVVVADPKSSNKSQLFR